MSCNLDCGCYYNIGVQKRNGLPKAVKEVIDRVISRGGNKNAQLLITIEWFNTTDLDIHVIEPSGRVGYDSKSKNGGVLDVDANVGIEDDYGDETGLILDPVENISYLNLDDMTDGDYELNVVLFKDRNPNKNDFNIYIFFKKQKDLTFTKVAKLTNKAQLKKGNFTKLMKFTKTTDNIVIKSYDETYVNVDLLSGIEVINWGSS